MTSLLRACAVLCAVMLLASCGAYRIAQGYDDRAMELHDRFDGSDSMGILAFGLTVDGAIPETGGSVSWIVDTPKPRDDDEADPAAAPEFLSDYRAVTWPKTLKSGRRRLVLWKVQAGTWSLRNARIGAGDGSQLTTVLVPHAFATKVQAGRITYAGDITLSTSHSAAPMLSLSRDDAFARTALNSYDGVTVPLDFGPLTDLREKKRHSH